MQLAKLGKRTAEQAPAAEQVRHTYPPVRMPSAEGVIAALTAPETWPDYAGEIGRFTPLRAGALHGQTFEIEVAAGTASRTDWLATARTSRGGSPERTQVLVGFDLTTHEAQHAFWGQGNIITQSMLHQLALQIAG